MSLNLPDVNSRGQALMKGSMEPEIVRVARTTGEAYAWNSQNINIDTTDTLLSIRNDSPTKNLVIDRLIFNAGDVAQRFEVYKVLVDYTAAGTAIVPVALGPRGGAASATSNSDETGFDQVASNVFMEVSLLPTTPIQVKCGLVLGGGEALGIDQIGEGAVADCIAFGYFVDRE